MVKKCREIEIVIKDGNFIHTTHDYFGETCEELMEIIKKFIDERALNFRYTEDRDDPRKPHRDSHRNTDDENSKLSQVFDFKKRIPENRRSMGRPLEETSYPFYIIQSSEDDPSVHKLIVEAVLTIP